MKRSLLFTLVLTLVCAASYAQSSMVVNTEKVFKSMPLYNEAINSMDQLSKQYQATIDKAFGEVETMYNDYQSQRQYLSESARKVREDAIITREKEINKYQQDVFGPEGDLMKKRVELLKPIQDNVFSTINKYAAQSGYTLVLDIAANQSILYYSPSSDKTEEIIQLLK